MGRVTACELTGHVENGEGSGCGGLKGKHWAGLLGYVCFGHKLFVDGVPLGLSGRGAVSESQVFRKSRNAVLSSKTDVADCVY